MLQDSLKIETMCTAGIYVCIYDSNCPHIGSVFFVSPFPDTLHKVESLQKPQRLFFKYLKTWIAI